MSTLDDFRAIAISSTFGTSLCLPLDSSLEATAFFVKSITGLDPPDNTLNMTDLIGGGRNYNGGRSLGRRIVITLGFNTSAVPGTSIAQLKRYIYRNFNAIDEFRPVVITLLNGYTVSRGVPGAEGFDDLGRSYKYSSNSLAYTYGYSAKIEANPFSKEPELVMTIDCESPYLTAMAATRQYFQTFDFSLQNDGDVGIGVYLDLNLASDIPNITLAGNSTGYGSIFTINKAFAAGDRVQIDTNFRTRNATTIPIKTGIITNLLPYSSAGWFVLYPGITYFTSNAVNSEISDVNVEFIPQYLGV